jgi:hypothetical protein
MSSGVFICIIEDRINKAGLEEPLSGKVEARCKELNPINALPAKLAAI